MNEFLQELAADCVRLLVAVLLGGVLGIERQLHGRWAGVRTHMMVSLGAAIFTIAAIATAPDDSNEVTRVIQGIAAGVGFLGAGTILKLSSEIEVKGLTTASSIWLAAALGTVAGMGQYSLAFASGLMSVLAILRPITKAVGKGRSTHKQTKNDHKAIHNSGACSGSDLPGPELFCNRTSRCLVAGDGLLSAASRETDQHHLLDNGCGP